MRRQVRSAAGSRCGPGFTPRRMIARSCVGEAIGQWDRDPRYGSESGLWQTAAAAEAGLAGEGQVATGARPDATLHGSRQGSRHESGLAATGWRRCAAALHGDLAGHPAGRRRRRRPLGGRRLDGCGELPRNRLWWWRGWRQHRGHDRRRWGLRHPGDWWRDRLDDGWCRRDSLDDRRRGSHRRDPGHRLWRRHHLGDDGLWCHDRLRDSHRGRQSDRLSLDLGRDGVDLGRDGVDLGRDGLDLGRDGLEPDGRDGLDDPGSSTSGRRLDLGRDGLEPSRRPASERRLDLGATASTRARRPRTRPLAPRPRGDGSSLGRRPRLSGLATRDFGARRIRACLATSRSVRAGWRAKSARGRWPRA